MSDVDPTSDRPVYQQVADVLRRRIIDGVVTAGDRMPSETELMGEFDISRTTARLTYGVLRSEGLIDAQRGKGAFVRQRRPVKRVALARYRQAIERLRDKGLPVATDTAFTRDQGIDWQDYRLDREFHEQPASAEVAELLGLDVGDQVLARHFVFYAADQPEQMSVSYLPLSLVAGTPVADPANEPWPGGTMAQLATLGVYVSRVEESVRARMPTPDERRTLQIDQGVPVLTVTRRMLDGDRPAEAAVDIVLPADRVVLDYAIDIPRSRAEAESAR